MIEPGLKRHFEDFQAGEAIELGERTITEPEIVSFARQFDPQSFHIDPLAARESIFGGLVASGWHTAGILMRLWVDAILAHVVSMGSPGVDSLRWPEPVRPGDRLRGRATVLELRASQSRPTMGIVRWQGELHNQDGRLVFSVTGTNFIGRRT